MEKSGDIIPKIIRVLEKMRTGEEKIFCAPQKCPICGSNVARQEIADKKNLDFPRLSLPRVESRGSGQVARGKQTTSVGLFCLNRKCFAQERERLIHFVSKKAFNIDGLGEKIVEHLMNEGLVKNPADFFTLSVGDLEPLERFAEKSADNLVSAIAAAKKVSLPRFIF